MRLAWQAAREQFGTCEVGEVYVLQFIGNNVLEAVCVKCGGAVFVGLY